MAIETADRINGRATLALSHSQRLRLHRIESWRWVRALAFDWAVIVAAFVAFGHSGRNLWLVPVVTLIVGSRLNGLGLLAHDAAHGVAFNGRRLNDWIGNVFCAWPMMLNITDNYRAWHLDHHRYVGTDRDSEAVLLQRPLFRAPVPFRRIVACFVGDWFGLGLPTVVTFVRAVRPTRWTGFVGPVLLWTAVLIATVCLDAVWVMVLWVYCTAFGFFVIGRVRTWTEHIGSDATWAARRFRPGPVTRFLFFQHNAWHHYEHHLVPQVPFYNLPKVRALDPTATTISARALFWDFAFHTDGARSSPAPRG